jgi:hypothetical protein
VIRHEETNMSETCPACGEAVENLYVCDDCATSHCVDCRLPRDHDCPGPAGDNAESDEAKDGAGIRYLGLTPLQWLAVPVVLLMARAGGAGEPGFAYLSGQVFAAFLIVYAGATVWKKVRGSAKSPTETSSDG